MKHIHVDVETYSECDLAREGAWKYSIHPSTKVLCLAYSTEDGIIQVVDGQEISSVIDDISSHTLHAWNAFFEYCIITNTLKKNIPISSWRCTMAKAAVAGMPLGLDDCAKRLGVSAEFHKDPAGKRLISKLCVPQKKAKNNDHLFPELKKYCIQDVKVEMHLECKLKDLSEKEQAIWEHYCLMNVRGIPFDQQLVNNALILIECSNISLDCEIQTLSNGKISSGTETKKIKDYLNLDSLSKENHEINIEKLKDSSPDFKRILEIRKDRSRTSNAKYFAISESCDNNTFRCRGALQHHGASTGRGAGRLVQPYNFPRSTISIDLVEDLATSKAHFFEDLYIDYTKLLSQCLRQTIKAPEGKILTVGDYSSIEAIVAAWLSGQEDMVEIFRTGGGKVYELSASKIYGIPVNEVTNAERQVGKVATLALGYQGGVKAFERMAGAYKLDLTILPISPEEIVSQWREENGFMTGYWKSLNKAAINSIEHPNIPFKCKKITFKTKDNFLYIGLPSGRVLSYFSPRLVEGMYGSQPAYMGYTTFNGAKVWLEQYMYGGKWMENITQAVSRDILTNAMKALELAEYPVIFEVYDEIVCETEEDKGSLKEMLRIMATPPLWGPDIPLEAKGYREQRYRK